MKYFFDKGITQSLWWTGSTICLLCALGPSADGHLTRTSMLFGSIGAMIWMVAVARILGDMAYTAVLRIQRRRAEQ